MGHEDDVVWILDHFLASPGAKVAMRTADLQVMMGMSKKGPRQSAEMSVFQVHTIVPRQHLDGRCVFLNGEGHCDVHGVSPFGCAFHDTHLDEIEADRRSQYAVRQQIAGHIERYGWLWNLLHSLNLRATSLESRRAAFTKAVARVERGGE
jgi:hypothetical protein